MMFWSNTAAADTVDWVDIAVLNFRHSPRHGRS